VTEACAALFELQRYGVIRAQIASRSAMKVFYIKSDFCVLK